MRVIVERPFARYSKGHVVPEMPDNQARALIARGLVREDEDAKAVTAPVNRMMAKAPERKSASR